MYNAQGETGSGGRKSNYLLCFPLRIVQTGYKVEGKYLKDDSPLPPLKVANHRESLTKDGPINKLCPNI